MPKLTRKIKRIRKEKNHKEIMEILDRGKGPLPKLLRDLPNKGEINPKTLSFVKLRSKAERFYPVGVRFVSSLGVKYQTLTDGSFQVLNKPRSRVKRIRQERIS